MSIINQTTENGVLPGGNGRNFQFGTFQFSTTDANGSLKLNLRKLDVLIITPTGVVATDENVSGPAMVAGKAGLVVPSTGAVTVQRVGSAKTSGLVCGYLAIGY